MYVLLSTLKIDIVLFILQIEGLMMDIAAAEEEITRWKVAAEQEAAAGRAVEQEFVSQVCSQSWTQNIQSFFWFYFCCFFLYETLLVVLKCKKTYGVNLV